MLLKADIVNLLHERGHTKVLAEEMIDDVIGVIVESLMRNEDVHLHGFGDFKVVQCNPGARRNIASKSNHIIEPYRSVRFYPGKTLNRYMRYGAEP